MRARFLRAALGLVAVAGAAGVSAAPWAQFQVRPRPVNVLSNPSFEANAHPGELPDGWEGRPGPVLDPTVAHRGHASLHIKGPGTGYLLQRSDLAPATAYVLRLWVKTQEVHGEGVALQYLQSEPWSELLSESAWLNGSSNWAELTTNFVTPVQHQTGAVMLRWSLLAGEQVWLDDVDLEPSGSAVPRPAAPTISPAAGTLPRGGTVTIESAVEDAEIRYTVDGSDPGPTASLYLHPFTLNGSATVQARVLRPNQAPGVIAAARYNIDAPAGAGVPFFPVDWNVAVQTWWDGNPLNPLTAKHLKSPISSPLPVINVAEVHRSYPRSKTAGLAEALHLLHGQGGTLWLPRSHGTYEISSDQNPVLSLSVSNLHLVSNGATIRAKRPLLAFTKPTEAALARDLMFKNLIFDGAGQAGSVASFKHCADVLFDGCAFQNFTGDGGAMLIASAQTDNIWCRRCSFGGGRTAAVWRGVHGGGFINCAFGPLLSQDAVALVTDDNSTPFSGAPRTAAYNVIAGCTFHAGDGRSADAIHLAGARCLVVDNDFSGSYGACVNSDGAECGSVPGLRYGYFGNLLESNRSDGTNTLLRVTGASEPYPAGYGIGAWVVEGNVASGLENMVVLDPGRGHNPLSNVIVRRNRLAGARLPVVRIDSSGANYIAITDNDLSGTARDLYAGPLPDKDSGIVKFAHNLIHVTGRPVAKRNAVIKPVIPSRAKAVAKPHGPSS